MKVAFLRITLLLCCLMLANAHAQLRKASDYFPLQVGNVWEYKPNPDFYPDRHIEIVGDTTIANSVRIYRALIRYVDDPGAGFGFNYYHYNADSTAVYQDIDFPSEPYSGLPMIDTRLGVLGLWYYLLGDVLGSFAITDTGTSSFFGHDRHWAEVNTVVDRGDTIVIAAGYHWRFAVGIGPIREGRDTLAYAKINGTEYGTPISSVDQRDSYRLPTKLALHSYPNPFTTTTVIEINNPTSQTVDLHVVNLLGQTVRHLFQGTLSPGQKLVNWGGYDDDGRRVSLGVYFLLIKANQYVITHKIVYLTDR